MQNDIDPTAVFKAMGDGKRAKIVEMLAHGELCACELLERFAMSQPTLSHHMKILCGCGLVQGREAGKWIYYSLRGETLAQMVGYLQRLAVPQGQAKPCACQKGGNEA